MSVKELFDKGYSLKFLKNKSQDNLREDLESPRFVEAYSAKRAQFVPDTDFATASNFARFGQAEEYYDQAIKRIYQTYPYDGSRAEKIEWENNSTYLDLFLFENEYPRTNGFVTFNGTTSTRTATVPVTFHYSSSSPEYITFAGGPHADPGGDYKSEFSAGPSKTGISKANVYHTASQKTNNLEFDLDKGATVEFWMKKDGFESTSASIYEYIFSNYSTSALNYEYFTIWVAGAMGASGLFVTINRASEVSFTLSFDTGLTTIADGVWHHYAVALKKSGTKTIANLYVDGAHAHRVESASTVSAFTGSLNGTIGASGHLTTGITKGLANIVSASFDEFRYWKTERDAQQIGRYYRDQIGGGTNTDNVKYDDVTNKVDLGVYFKFNEGITGNSSTDATVLDYSGRISNGTFVNYGSASRSTGSAIVLSNAATKEFKDPIIYSSHPDVSALATRYQLSGSFHDHENPASIYKSLPSWIVEEDEKESKHLKQLTQIIASYFDDLYLLIEKLPHLKDVNFPADTEYEKALPFADRLLTSRGFPAPELFGQASQLATYLERDEKKLFDKKLYEVKNMIYQNIYNNLPYIQKSKGTFKALRNFLRCFGVGEELIKLNVYARDDVYEFKDNYTNTSIQKRYIDFDDLETRLSASYPASNFYTATAYQYYNSTDSNSKSYFPARSAVDVGANAATAITVEAEVVFPKRKIKTDDNYMMFPSVTSSIFGMENVAASDTDLTYDATNKGHFNIVAIRPDNDLRNVKFAMVTSSGGGGTCFNNELFTPTTYKRVYDNQKWNLAFRMAPTKAVKDGRILQDVKLGTNIMLPAASAYTYELYGVNYLSNILQEEFTISGTMSTSQASDFFTDPQRFFIGAKRTNFTGSVERYSDIKVSSLRVWHDYLSNEAIRAHAKDASNHGVLYPYRNINDNIATGGLSRQPSITSLALHWGMNDITGSDSAGQFLIKDTASGSVDSAHKFGEVWSKDYKNYNYAGRGDYFITDSGFLDQAVDIDFISTAKQKHPEVANSDDMIKILNNQDDVLFTRDTTYVQHLLSVEKSMYQVISDEMLKLFATVISFNNLVGDPVNRYRPNYKNLEKLRELFFLNVENDSLDLEKFIEFYKWLDDALTIMITQLVPVSSNMVEMLKNMVESHVLERNKYWTKFPTSENNIPEPISSLKAIEELKYNWKFGHAPLSAEQNTNQDQSCLWWKQRAGRDDVLASGVSAVDADKESMLKIVITEVTGTEPTLKTSTGTRYAGSYYYNRSLARPVDLVIHKSLKLKAGSNPDNNNIHEFYKGATKWASDDDFIYLDVDNRIQETVCNDQDTPPELDKKEFRMKALVMTAEEISGSTAAGDGAFDKQYTDAKSSLLVPFNMYSSSVNTGYISQWSSQFGVDITNAHEDKYGPHSEIPMQGPFTEKHVGGSQHRHVALNQGSDVPTTRAEGWHLQEFLNADAVDYLLYENFVNATTTATTDVNILNIPLGPGFSDTGETNEPSPHEYWTNGVGDNNWTFLKGPTPSAGTGPGAGAHSATAYAYCEVLPSKVGQTFGLVTPLIDLLEVDPGSDVKFAFSYHMHGLGIGNLKVQASQDPNFETAVTDLKTISGQQHTDSNDAFTAVDIGSIDYGLALADWLGKRFYIRFLYTAGPSHLGDCAIARARLYKSTGGSGVAQDSFKLLSPTYDNHNRPSATRMRDEYAKRPVNIRNIQMTGSSPTKAGNYLDRYEYVNVMSEQNDPWFVTNVDSITRTTAETLVTSSAIASRLSGGVGINYTLPDRTFISGTIRNRTRFTSRFSSPGGYEVMSRGFLDPAHETYSVYNAMTYRNLRVRQVYNTQLQAHQGRFGVSAHSASTARVYGDETAGTIQSADYIISGDASKHKYPRNNIEKIQFTGDDSTASNAVFVTASVYDNAFVSHMIPRTDNQTRWLTASLI